MLPVCLCLCLCLCQCQCQCRPSARGDRPLRRRQRHRRQHRLVVVFNNQQTVNLRNDKFKSGPALQLAGGTIRFRKVSIKAL